jgi:hypothetical protein
MGTYTLTLSETKARCAFYGYSVKKECGEFRAYPKGKPELDIFEANGWDLFQTVRASAIHAFTVKVDNCESLEGKSESRDALVAWFESEGADWKNALYKAWYNGNYSGHSYSGELQQLRNSIGYDVLADL